MKLLFYAMTDVLPDAGPVRSGICRRTTMHGVENVKLVCSKVVCIRLRVFENRVLRGIFL
jgi:hypothetical protein